MEYGKIISITGMGGLFELVGSKKDGAIVKSLEDNSVKFVSSRIHNFSHLESIEVYTVRDNANLVDLLKAIDASGKSLPNEKDAAAVKSFFEDVYPDMDFERVYASDMKKMVKWYSVLKANDVEFVLSEPEEEEEEEDAVEKVEEKSAPVKTADKAEPIEEDNTVTSKAADKKTKTAAKETEETTVKEEEAPKKKAPRKKKSEN